MKFLTNDGWKEIELSPWAKYVAQDEDGSWWEYTEPEPIEDYGEWVRSRILLCYGPKPKDWTQELYEVY